MDDLTLVRKMYRGRFAIKLAEDLRAMAAEVQAAGKPGAITVKIEVKPGAGGMSDPEKVLDVTFSRTMPKGRTVGTVLYLTDDGDLQQDDPRQIGMDGFHVVDNAPAPQTRTVEPQQAITREA